jgi:hypothetical protein
MKTTLPSNRIEQQTLERMNAAIKKYNSKSFVKLSMQEYRRLSYEVLAQLILRDEELPLDLE